MAEEVVTVERARRYAQRWFPMNAIDDGSPMIGETRLAHITLQLCDEIERLRNVAAMIECPKCGYKPKAAGGGDE